LAQIPGHDSSNPTHRRHLLVVNPLMKFKIQNVKLKMAFTLIELLVAIAVIGIPAEDEARQD
jgi:hypothetical protein